MSRDPRDWQTDKRICEQAIDDRLSFLSLLPEIGLHWLREVKQLKEDNARLTCQFTGAEQKYLKQSNTLAELRGRAERAEEREQKFEGALLDILSNSDDQGAIECASAALGLDREDTNDN